MANIVVATNKSFNGVKFGAKREDVRKKFGTFTEFYKTPKSKETTDDFGDFHCYYSNGKLEAVEVFKFDSIKIDGLDIKMDIKKSDISIIADDFEEDDGAFISKNKSIAIVFYDNHIDSALFGEKDYYE